MHYMEREGLEKGRHVNHLKGVGAQKSVFHAQDFLV